MSATAGAVMEHSEFALVRMRSAAGVEEYAFTLTRDGVAAEVHIGQPVGGQERLFSPGWRRCLASHVSDVGLRALSSVAPAARDFALHAVDVSPERQEAGRVRV